MADDHGWGPSSTDVGAAASPPTAPTGLTQDVLATLDGAKPVKARGRVTNTATYVLGGAALLVGTFSAGAWVGRDNAPTSASTTGGAAAALGAPGAGASGASGFAGRSPRASGAEGASGATGVVPGATGANGAFPGGAAGGLGGATTGTVTSVDGTTLTITTAQGASVKVTLSPQSQITVSKTGTAADLTTGETVVVQGETAADGSITAASVRAGAAGATAFGGRGGGAIPGGGGGGAASGATGAPAGR